jgi:hypothetical protein
MKHILCSYLKLYRAKLFVLRCNMGLCGLLINGSWVGVLALQQDPFNTFTGNFKYIDLSMLCFLTILTLYFNIVALLNCSSWGPGKIQIPSSITTLFPYTTSVQYWYFWEDLRETVIQISESSLHNLAYIKSI